MGVVTAYRCAIEGKDRAAADGNGPQMFARKGGRH
ncbi:hypothetical protein COLO4_19727 [Corchorus olitorius]|uniref:Uncharacterized protein n=1 Tax=Corchorus olitorius TaxID=93759 RepID=A0A1R3J3V1_9ROSI|nr:hypothetical protein COLO4_19727 [Corchorus olitorius]